MDARGAAGAAVAPPQQRSLRPLFDFKDPHSWKKLNACTPFFSPIFVSPIFRHAYPAPFSQIFTCSCFLTAIRCTRSRHRCRRQRCRHRWGEGEGLHGAPRSPHTQPRPNEVGREGSRGLCTPGKDGASAGQAARACSSTHLPASAPSCGVLFFTPTKRLKAVANSKMTSPEHESCTGAVPAAGIPPHGDS